MKKLFGLSVGLTISLAVALSYFLFCPHAGRNGRTVEVHLHVVPLDGPNVRMRPHGEPSSGQKFEVPDGIIDQLEKKNEL